MCLIIINYDLPPPYIRWHSYKLEHKNVRVFKMLLLKNQQASWWCVHVHTCITHTAVPTYCNVSLSTNHPMIVSDVFRWRAYNRTILTREDITTQRAPTNRNALKTQCKVGASTQTLTVARSPMNAENAWQNESYSSGIPVDRHTLITCICIAIKIMITTCTVSFLYD